MNSTRNPITQAFCQWLTNDASNNDERTMGMGETLISRLDIAIAKTLYGLQFATHPKPPQFEIVTLNYTVCTWLSDEFSWDGPYWPNVDGAWSTLLLNALLQVDFQIAADVYLHHWLERGCYSSHDGVTNRIFLAEFGIEPPTDWDRAAN